MEQCKEKNRSEQCLRKKEGHNEVKLFTSFPRLSYQGKIERYKDKWTGKIKHEWAQRNLHKKMKALTINICMEYYML